MKWNYAELSKAAKEFGDPEAFIHILQHQKDSEIKSAILEGKKSMIKVKYQSGLFGILIGYLIGKGSR